MAGFLVFTEINIVQDCLIDLSRVEWISAPLQLFCAMMSVMYDVL